MTRGKYDLMQVLKWGRCPRCHSFLVPNLAGTELTCCMANGCHWNEDWPEAEIADAGRAYIKRQGKTIDDFKLRSGG